MFHIESWLCVSNSWWVDDETNLYYYSKIQIMRQLLYLLLESEQTNAGIHQDLWLNSKMSTQRLMTTSSCADSNLCMMIFMTWWFLCTMAGTYKISFQLIHLWSISQVSFTLGLLSYRRGSILSSLGLWQSNIFLCRFKNKVWKEWDLYNQPSINKMLLL